MLPQERQASSSAGVYYREQRYEEAAGAMRSPVM